MWAANIEKVHTEWVFKKTKVNTSGAKEIILYLGIYKYYYKIRKPG